MPSDLGEAIQTFPKESLERINFTSNYSTTKDANMHWKKRTKRVKDAVSKRRYWTSTDDQFQIVYTESLLTPKPWRKLPKNQRSKYLTPVYQVFTNSGDGFTWLTRKYFRTFKAAERAIVKASK